MTNKDIIRHRLLNQRIAQSDFTKPEQVVAHLVAMQAQDWSMAKWAIGLRLPGSTDADVEKAFNDGKILRTHVLRPTWHFVTPADIRWMLQLTAQRVHTMNGMYYRKFDLNEKVLSKTKDILRKELSGSNYKTREELNAKFANTKISADRLKLSYIMMHAELEGLICSGPRIGKQFTYALIEERAPKAISLTRDEALQKLTAIYFSTRGPATIADYAWWSGLKVAEIKKAVASLDDSFTTIKVKEAEYIFQQHELPAWRGMRSTFLMPDYDEYGIGFKDRTMYTHPEWKPTSKAPGQEYYHAIVVDGYMGGTWTKVTKGDKPVITVDPFAALPAKRMADVKKAVVEYNRFFGVG